MNFTNLTTAVVLDSFLDSHPLFKHACDVWKETKDYENAIKFEPFTILRDKSSSEKEIFLGEVLVSNDHKNWFKLNHMFLPLGRQYNGDYVKIPSFYESEYTTLFKKYVKCDDKIENYLDNLLKIDTSSPYLKMAYEESLKWWKELHKYE